MKAMKELTYVWEVKFHKQIFEGSIEAMTSKHPFPIKTFVQVTAWSLLAASSEFKKPISDF